MRPAALLLALLAPACGLGLRDDPSGGGENLPTLGAGPFGKLEIDFDTPADEPYVLADAAASLDDPTVLPRAEGGYRLWFGRAPDVARTTSEIWSADLADLHQLPAREPELALAADADWEAGRVAAPAVIAGAGDTLVMIYEGGPAEAPALGRADSADGGLSWTKHAANPLLDGGGRPTVVDADGTWQIFFTRADARGIFRADSSDGVAFTAAADPVLLPRGGQAFDQVGVGDPAVLAGETEAGQLHYGLYYTGADDEEDVAIGYAGSFDGWEWERFGGLGPVLAEGSPAERGPAVVLGPTHGVMFFTEVRSGHQRIAVAVHP